MHTTIAYGKNGLTLNLPDDVQVLKSKFCAGLPDEAAALQHALRNPIGSEALSQRVKAGDKVVITHSDITRATPNERILPVLLAELAQAGVKQTDITLINALGTHRPQTEAELRRMLGEAIVDNYRCMQHDAFDDENLVAYGSTSLGHPLRLNRCLQAADLVIVTGFIEPHFFAGFSGGPKGILPALAGYESVLTNHGAEMISHPKATWGINQGNPVWEEMREAALKLPNLFLLNVTMNEARQISGVFAGHVIEAHQSGTDFVRQTAMVAVDEPFDIVITTNSGYPLDQNVYQAIKGVSAASRIVRKGGAIVMAAACEEGLPDNSGYARLLAGASSPKEVLHQILTPGFSAPDQWTVQIQAQIQQDVDVYLFSEGLTTAQIQAALLLPMEDIQQQFGAIRAKYGPRVCVIPEGPQTIAYVGG